jgi:hypothetical protein
MPAPTTTAWVEGWMDIMGNGTKIGFITESNPEKAPVSVHYSDSNPLHRRYALAKKRSSPLPANVEQAV